MKDILMNDFLKRADDHFETAARDDEIYKVKTDVGVAVVLSESEYNIMRDALKLCTGSKDIKC